MVRAKLQTAGIALRKEQEKREVAEATLELTKAALAAARKQLDEQAHASPPVSPAQDPLGVQETVNDGKEAPDPILQAFKRADERHGSTGLQAWLADETDFSGCPTLCIGQKAALCYVQRLAHVIEIKAMGTADGEEGNGWYSAARV